MVLKKFNGHSRVMPYAIIKDAMAFIEFTRKLFNAKEVERSMRSENVVAHAELQLDDSRIMVADATDEFQPFPIQYFIYVENADKVFQKALDMGAASIKEPFDESYGARSACIMDPFGNLWWMASLY